MNTQMSNEFSFFPPAHGSQRKSVSHELYQFINHRSSLSSQRRENLSISTLKAASTIPSKSNINARSLSSIIPKKSNSTLILNRNKILARNLKHLTQKLFPLKEEEAKEFKYFHQTYDFRTKTGTLGLLSKSHNQDSYFCFSKFQGKESQSLYGVCDGHGLHGHIISAEIKEKFPEILNKRLNYRAQEGPALSMKKCIIKLHKELVLNKNINTDFSGSTLVSVLIIGKLLTCASVGDSRAVLGRKTDKRFVAIPLSKDHKPDNLTERKRIESFGGRVDTLYTHRGSSVGPLRVWIGNQDTPGLAMSRSIGDRFATEVGVIPDPDMRQFELTKDDKFIILASDGLWDVMSNEEAVSLCKVGWEFGYPQSACDSLLKEANKRWSERNSNNDDITVIVIFLKTA
ncbi:unnamed protein product [Blepharisma stoltei]|uniref:PPM-type phosphatase domain-containing protein n=1 Tax=Blepharisma stoltei TaxID=1481888 RepID=A0AAU9K2Z0_9CILI|nr:unnamed protein product [Blepharisma stoltei]